jgi:hypothetical protein
VLPLASGALRPRRLRHAPCLGRPRRLRRATRLAFCGRAAASRLAFGLRLPGFALVHALLDASQVALIFLLALIFRSARIAQRYGDGLFRVLHFAAAGGAELAMLELLHHPADGFRLTTGGA